MTSRQPAIVHGAGPGLAEARACVLLIHGRGATADSILGLAAELGNRRDVAFRAPQAAGRSWYPKSFLAPIEENEPALSASLEVIAAALAEARAAGVPSERQLLLGFSQGACLTLEFVARNPRLYGGVVGFTGGLLGPRGTRWDELSGSLDGTPVFLGSSDPDPHVPWRRVEETAAVFARLGAEVRCERYPGMGHTINSVEIEAAREMIETLGAGGASGED